MTGRLMDGGVTQLIGELPDAGADFAPIDETALDQMVAPSREVPVVLAAGIGTVASMAFVGLELASSAVSAGKSAAERLTSRFQTVRERFASPHGTAAIEIAPKTLIESLE